MVTHFFSDLTRTMMPFIYTQGDSSMKLKGVGLKCPEKNILNRKISFYERSLSNEVQISK